MTKDIQKWADEAMFTAEPSDASKGPEVFFLQGTPDPLGSIAAFSAMYTGKVIRNKADVTDEDRRYHLEEMKKTKLKAPLEAVNLHFMVEGVTRSFTHQMVRQRTAVYAQESLRFAVKEDAAEAVATPPFLAGTMPLAQWCDVNDVEEDIHPELSDLYHREDEPQKMRLLWDYQNRDVSETYNHLVNMGLPAEDARGLLPHNITTRLNYATNLRNLQDHAGNRLCTQAQFEWRMFWVKMIEAMRNYCTSPICETIKISGEPEHNVCDNWQWNEIANLFRPVCYLTGQCEFKAQFDRKCKIRERVDANADINRPSSEWDQDYGSKTFGGAAKGIKVEHKVHENQRDTTPTFIGGISPAEWLLDDGAAR